MLLYRINGVILTNCSLSLISFVLLMFSYAYTCILMQLIYCMQIWMVPEPISLNLILVNVMNLYHGMNLLTNLGRL